MCIPACRSNAIKLQMVLITLEYINLRISPSLLLSLLKAGLSFKHQIQPTRQPHRRLSNTPLHDRPGIHRILPANLSALQRLRRNRNHLMANLLISIARPRNGRLFLRLQVFDRMVLQPLLHILAKRAGIDGCSKVVGPSERVCGGDVCVGREGEDGIGDCGVPGCVQVGFVAVECYGNVVASGAPGFSVKWLCDVAQELRWKG